MADTKTESTNLPPQALVSEIERTRTELARTIDEISDRVNPSKVAQRTADRVRERISQIDPLVAGGAVLAVAGVTCFVLWRRFRK